MTRALVVCSLLLAVAAGGAASAPATDRETVHALVWKGRTLSLARLDAVTLIARGGSLALGRLQGSFYADTLGDRVAVASPGTGIVVVDTRRRRVAWRIQRGMLVRAVAWLSPSRLLVAEHGGTLLLDPHRKRIVGRSDYDGLVRASARWDGGLVLLAHRNEGEIRPARLVVVGPGVRTRSVELDRIPAGWASGPTGQTPFNHAQPALAVDRDGGRAFVAGGSQLATIDLSTLVVSYSGAERTLQKVTTGPRRSAGWLGGGTLALAGADESWRDDGVASTPFGLRLVTAGGVRLVDERATDVRTTDGLALAYGVHYIAGRTVGIGITAYDVQGVPRWRLFGASPVTEVVVVDELAYVWASGRWHAVELATGAIVGSSPLSNQKLIGGS